MDLEHVQELSDLFDKRGLTRMEVCDGDTKVLFERQVPQVICPSFEPGHQQPPQGHAPQSAASDQPHPLVDTTVSGDGHQGNASLHEVKSPMVGVFYAAPTPGAEPFVTVGSKVRKGDVLCVLEAMKLMNDIVAEDDGEIAEVCVENGQVVEFSQTLFRIF